MKKPNQSLYTLATADYLWTRIEEHYKLYPSIPNQINEQQSLLFKFFYCTLIYHLTTGNTLLWLGSSSVKGQGGINLALNAVFDTIDSAIGQNDISHQMLIERFCVDEESTTPSLIDKHIEDTISKAQSAKLGQGDQEQLRKLLRLSLEFARWYYKTLNADLTALYDTLKQSRFFITGNESTSNPMPFVLSDWQNEAFGIWLYRSWLSEMQLGRHIIRLLSEKPTSTKVDPKSLATLNIEQKQAIATCLNAQFTIITGGPGTGKTYTVAKIVNALLASNPDLSIALSAPTGKAAQRLGESLQLEMGSQATSFDTTTIHRLLGMGVSGVPRYNTENPLPYDVVIIDEASMLGVELSFKLILAIKTGAKLILLGDAYQLSAVEAGAVLADLCRIPMLKKYHQTLIESRRFDSKSGVGLLATMVNDKTQTIEYEQIASLIDAQSQLSLTLIQKTSYADLLLPYKSYFEQIKQIKHLLSTQKDTDSNPKIIQSLFETFNHYRILTATHQGKFGDLAINQAVLAHFFTKNPPTWYHGRAIMIIKNTYELGLYNGDVGLCVEQDGVFMVYFDGNPIPTPANILPQESVVDAYAITIHKSQGSEFDHVAVCFDDTAPHLLSKELIYTAITRAKKQVSLYTTKTALSYAVNTPTIRQTGLSLILKQDEID